MKKALLLGGVLLSCALQIGCTAVGNNACTIDAAVTPATATADHSMLPPGNQAQFSTTSTVTGNCPLIPDQTGSWTTSDTVNTAISNQSPTQGLATCLSATPSAATISYTGTVRGHAFTPATLTCK